jgi:hypothetical protein
MSENSSKRVGKNAFVPVINNNLTYKCTQSSTKENDSTKK